MAKRPSLIPLPNVLSRLLKSHGMEGHMREYLLQKHWTEIVGDHVGHHAWPASIRHHKLYLLVENSAWMQQLLYLKPDLLAKINAAAEGEPLTDIVFRIGPVATPQASAGRSDRETSAQTKEAENQPLSSDLSGEIESSVYPVSDPILRERLRGLLTKSLQAARKKP